MASANEFSPFSSSFLFNLLLIYTFNICIRQPLWLVTLGTSLKTKLPCVASRGSLEDRSRVTGEFLSPKGVLLHTLNNSSNCFSSMFLLAGRIAIILNALLDSSYTVAPHSLWEQCLCAAYVCVPRAHTHWLLVQLTSKCAAGGWKGVQASLLSHNPLSCVSLPLSFVVFS